MKVLVVANAFPKYSETFIRNHVIKLLDSGIEVYILVDDINEIDALKGFESYDLMSRTTSLFKLLPKDPISKLLNSISLVNSSSMKAQGFSLRELLGSFLKKGLRASIYEVHMLDYIIQNKINIVHAHFGNNGEKMSFVSKYGIKLFTTFHGYDIRAGLKSGKKIYKNLLASDTPIISISDYNKTSLITMGFSESCILDLSNGIDTDFFLRKESHNKAEKLRLITIARLSPEKGLDIAIKSIKNLIDDSVNLDVEYTIVGEGKSRTELEKLIEDLKLKNVVKLIGAKSSIETRDKLITSDLFLLPSLAEALPTVILEAQSAELPVLATKVGSVENMVKGGLVVKANNLDDFKRGLLDLLNNRKKWQEMGVLGRNHVIANHSINKQTKKLIEFYKSV